MAPQDPNYGTFTSKDGSVTRVAETPEQAVRFRYDGWREITAAPPPRAGKGSGREAWVAYAARNDVAVEDDANRDDVIAALKAAGVDVGEDEDNNSPQE